jgi:hypothetical protein
MSVSNESHWIERWGLLFVIAYGLLFVTLLVSFHPTSH